MIVSPQLKDYNINVLIVLGNQTNDFIIRNEIKFLIVDKLMIYNYPFFIIINKFLNSNKILKEAYAELITIRMKTEEYNISDNIMDEIIKLVSLDTLIHYGAESCSKNFCKKCKDEFWNRGLAIEDKAELVKKRSLSGVN